MARPADKDPPVSRGVGGKPGLHSSVSRESIHLVESSVRAVSSLASLSVFVVVVIVVGFFLGGGASGIPEYR